MAWTPELCRADSDGDGLSNGAELGDPDCTWSKGGARRVALSHPGIPDAPAVGRRRLRESHLRRQFAEELPAHPDSWPGAADGEPGDPQDAFGQVGSACAVAHCYIV